MKKLFFILLLANAIFLGLVNWGILDWENQENQESLPLHEEKIRLLEASKIEIAKSALSSVTASVSVPAEQQPSDLQLSMNISVPSASQKDTQSCLEWGDFSGQELERAATVLAGLQLANKPNQREIEQDTGYWVYIPPLKNKSAANKKIAELKILGINEYFVVSNAGHMQHAISLGVFKTQEAAQNFLNYLRTKGVRSAQLGEHASKLKATRFTLGAVSSETRNRLIALQKDFSGSELVTIPCQAH